MSRQENYLKLNRTGDNIPLVGFGAGRISPEATEDVVYNAIKTGNEAEVEKAIRKTTADKLVKREDLFTRLVISKLWNLFHHKGNVRPAFKVTLKDLGLEYTDLYLVHLPFATEFIELKSKSFFANAEGLVKWVKEQDIQIISYASFGNAAFDNISPVTKHLKNPVTHEAITKVADKHKKNAGQILLAWAMQQNIIVIPKSVQVDRMKTNFDLFSFKLDEQDLAEVDVLEANGRFNDLLSSTLGIELPLWE